MRCTICNKFSGNDSVHPGCLPATEAQIEAIKNGDWLSAIEPGREYYKRRTEGWDWFGVERWWEVSVVFANGFHGGGGACIEELWRWNDSAQVMRREPKRLSFSESMELVARLVAPGVDFAALARADREAESGAGQCN